MNYKKGQSVFVYGDWENNKDLIGVALLLEHRKTSLPFIPEYSEGEEKSVDRMNHFTYKAELWNVIFITLTPFGRKAVERKYLQDYWIRFISSENNRPYKP